jgi:hypothetical protein
MKLLYVLIIRFVCTQSDRLYWAFSIDELIKYDLSAMIDYNKNYTKKGIVLLNRNFIQNQ